MLHIALVLAAASAQVAPVDAPPSDAAPAPHKTEAGATLDGNWVGGMTVPAGLVIPFELLINGEEGRFAAPDQGAHDIPIQVTVTGDAVIVTVPSAGARFTARRSHDGTVLEGEWRQGDRAFPAMFRKSAADAASRGAAARPQTPVGPFPYLSEDIVIAVGASDVRLGATLTRPNSATGEPGAILLLGGNGPQDRDETYARHKPMAVLADYLTRQGLAVLRFDKRGVGQSTGDYAALTSAALVTDAKAALDYLKRQNGISTDRVCVLGLSEGATIAATLTRESNVSCLVLLSPPGEPPINLFAAQKRDAARASGLDTAASDRLAQIVQKQLESLVAGGTRDDLVAIAAAGGLPADKATRLAEEWLSPEVRTLLGNHPTAALAAYEGPVLVITGSLDRQVDPTRNLPPIREALGDNPKARFVHFEGLNHVLQPARTGNPSEYADIATTIDPQALKAVTAFLLRALRR